MAPIKKTAPKSAPKRVHKVASTSITKTTKKVAKATTSPISSKKQSDKSAALLAAAPVAKAKSPTLKSTVQVAKTSKPAVLKPAPKAASKVASIAAPKAAGVKAARASGVPVDKKQPAHAAVKIEPAKIEPAKSEPANGEPAKSKVSVSAVMAAKPATPAAEHTAVKPAVAAQAMAARPPQVGQRAMPAAAAKPGQQKLTAPAAPAAMLARGATAAAATLGSTAAAIAAAASKKPVNARHGFKTNEFVVYPAHGVGRIIGIEEQEIAGISLELFVIQFEKDKMTLRVPTSKLQSVGMRKLAEEGIVKRAMETLKGKARIKRTMWSRRAQEYEAKINSGDLVAIAEVVRDLYRSEAQPEQSYSERQLYEAALDRMAREIAAVDKLDERSAMQRITEVLSKSARGRRAAEEEAAASSAAEVKAA